MLPGESKGVGLEKFFMNTLDRNGKGQRPDVQVPIHAFGTGKSEAADLSGDYDSYYTGLLYGQWYHDYTLPVTSEFSPPSSPSQISNPSAWDTLHQFVRCKRNLFYRWGMEIYVPRLSSYHPYASQLPAATFSLDEAKKSRGIGTYIPEMTRHSFKDMHTPVRTRNSESLNHVQWMKSYKKVGQDEHLPEKNNSENGCYVNLSLEEFPLLPITKKAPPSENNHQFDESTDETTPVDNCCPRMATIMFGTYKHSLTLARIMKDSGTSTSLDSEPDHSVMEKQNLELCERDNEKYNIL